MIPMCDVGAQYRALRSEIDTAMQTVAEAGHYILGPQVTAFEAEVAAYSGCAHAVGVNSGTDALHLALRALGIGPGDEVITTPFTFIATTEAIGIVGATPVFVEIDPLTGNLDPSRLVQALTPRTRAILPVHLYGHPCEMDPILAVAQAHGLYVIEDCAQAMGACYRGRMVGTLGHLGCLSFFPSKNLGALGDGGMVLTNDPALAERVEMLRRHGGKVKYYHSELGLNSRLDELQAAILRVKLRHLDEWLRRRRAHAAAYTVALAQVPGVEPLWERLGQEWRRTGVDPAFPESALYATYHQYTVLVEGRETVQEALKGAGVASAIYYPVPLHLQRVHADLGGTRGSFPAAEWCAERCLSLPIYPELSATARDQVILALRSAVSAPCRQAAV
jgi:dTDP-4-amino-4,6-dideoxygalactose transaminase